MKKIIVVLLCVLFVTGCGTSKEATIKEKQISFDGHVISLGDEMNTVEEKLGKEYELTESKSCLYDGMDKVFAYDEINVFTYPEGEKDYVNSISFASENVTWAYDIQVGDTADTVRDVMQEECTEEEDYLMTYELEDYGISFYLEESKITEIVIYLL